MCSSMCQSQKHDEEAENEDDSLEKRKSTYDNPKASICLPTKSYLE